MLFKWGWQFMGRVISASFDMDMSFAARYRCAIPVASHQGQARSQLDLRINISLNRVNLSKEKRRTTLFQSGNFFRLIL